MKTTQYNESFVKQGYKAHSSMFYEVNGTKFKFTYEHGNSFENFKMELFDGLQLNLIGILTDLNEKRLESPYHMGEIDTKNRVAVLNDKARKYVEKLVTIKHLT